MREDTHRLMVESMGFTSSAVSPDSVIKTFSGGEKQGVFDTMTGLPSISVDSSIEFKPDSLGALFNLLRDVSFSRAVVVIDEFQDILNLKDAAQTLAIMRSTIQFLENMPFVFCGSILNRMDSIFNDHQSPFFKSAQTIEVGPIDHVTFRDFINRRFVKGGLKVAPAVIETIFQTAGENPGDIQQLCSALYDTVEKNGSIGEVEINEALTYIFAQEQKGYEACLTQVTALQLKCLTAVARSGGRGVFGKEFLARTGIRQPSTVRKSLQRLLDLKILLHVDGEYRFVNPYFARWLVWRNF